MQQVWWIFFCIKRLTDEIVVKKYSVLSRSLRQLLDKEMLESASLRLQVEEMKTEKASYKEAHHATVQAMSR